MNATIGTAVNTRRSRLREPNRKPSPGWFDTADLSGPHTPMSLRDRRQT
jgi:hypothetical protein